MTEKKDAPNLGESVVKNYPFSGADNQLGENLRNLHHLNKYNDILFWSGVFITVAGILIGQSQRISPIHRRISPAYFRAKDGCQKLFKDGLLTPRDRGFHDIASLFIERTRRINSNMSASEWSAVAPTVSVLSFHMSAGVAFYPDPEKGEIHDRLASVRITDGHQVREGAWPKQSIIDDVEKLKDRHVMTSIASDFGGLFRPVYRDPFLVEQEAT